MRVTRGNLLGGLKSQIVNNGAVVSDKLILYLSTRTGKRA